MLDIISHSFGSNGWEILLQCLNTKEQAALKKFFYMFIIVTVGSIMLLVQTGCKQSAVRR